MNRFVILTTQRSGSTYLVRALDSHPEIRCYGELFINNSENINKEDDYRYFHYLREKWYRRILLPLASKSYINSFLEEKLSANGNRAIGFKLMYNQCDSALLDWIKANNISVIHLVRENLLHSLVSTEIRHRTKIAHSSDVVKIDPFEIDVKMILRQLTKRRVQIQAYRDEFSNYSKLIEISYDDYFSNKRKKNFEILSFLGADNGYVIESDLKKINTHEMRDILLNYEELMASLKNTPFEKMVK